MGMESYIGKNGGGVPNRIFANSRFVNIISGQSGNPLSINISPGTISIADILPNSPCHFIASVINGVLEFDVKTKGFKGISTSKHPDLYALKLIEKSLVFFQNNNTKIHTIHNEWEYNPEEDKTSDFYFQFIGGVQDNPTQEEMIEVAKKTIPGIFFCELGYKKVDEVLWNKGFGLEKITVDFKR